MIEPVLDPGVGVIDAHHHLYHRPAITYLLDDYARDCAGGHRIVGSVLVQARGGYRTGGAEHLRPLGETELALDAAREAQARGVPTRVCAGVVGHADLMRGGAVRDVLEGHLALTQGQQAARFCGIRHILAWDADAALLNPAYPTSEAMMDSADFRAGFACLAPLGLTFDAWLYFHQLPALARLARAFPETPMVINHCGGILGIGAFAGQHDAVFAAWFSAMRDLAQCPQVMVKLSGLGMASTGLATGAQPSSQRLAEAWAPWMDACIELFSPQRCMAASNFPADRPAYDFGVGFNALKRIARRLDVRDYHAIMMGNANRFYRLGLDGEC